MTETLEELTDETETLDDDEPLPAAEAVAEDDEPGCTCEGGLARL